MANETVVIETTNCVVILDTYGFYVKCLAHNCTWVSDYTPSKPTARKWAITHDKGP